MDRHDTREAIKVMQHYADGGEVEFWDKDEHEWKDVAGTPNWGWSVDRYRIKPNYVPLDADGLRELVRDKVVLRIKSSREEHLARGFSAADHSVLLNGWRNPGDLLDTWEHLDGTPVGKLSTAE